MAANAVAISKIASGVAECPLNRLTRIETHPAQAQDQLPVETNFKTAYLKATRSIIGSPGRNYRQNTADYQIQVNFEPLSRTVSGKVHIDYVNKNSDSLHQVLFKL